MWPQGCRADTGCHNQQALVQMTHGPEDSSHTPGRVGWEWRCRGSGDNSISGDTNDQECYKIQKAAVKSLCFCFPISQI